MPLTDTAVRNTKPGSKPIKLSDSGGLQLHISVAGGRTWNLAFRFEGKQQKLRLGSYPATSLSEARAARDAARKLLDRGINPIEHGRAKQADEQAATAVAVTTFRVVAAELLAKKRAEGRAVNTLAKLTWLLDVANADIGDKPVTAIKPADVLAMLRKVEAKGHRETAKRLRSLVSECFRFAIATDRAEADPAAPLIGALTAPIVKNRAAITDPVAFGALLRAVDGFKGQATTRAALQLMALLFPRPGELRFAEWSEFDLDAAIWTVPAARTKLRKEHKVPLSDQAIAILRDLHRSTGRGKLVLPGYGVSGGEGRKVEQRPISENTMLAAILRLGYDRSEHSAHGFRASASTLLYESGRWSGEAIEAQLAHADTNQVRAAYKRSVHWPERVAMMTWWGSELDRLRLLKPSR